MLCKCYWIVLYIVRVTAFCLGGPFFSGHGVLLWLLLLLLLLLIVIVSLLTYSSSLSSTLSALLYTSRVATRLLGHSRGDSTICERSRCCGWASGWVRATCCARSACCDTPSWPACSSQASYSANIQVYIIAACSSGLWAFAAKV